MKILICTAGSGGHIYPALSLAKYLKHSLKTVEFIFLCPPKAIARKIFDKEEFRVIYCDFNLQLTNNPIIFLLKISVFLVKSIVEAIKIFFLLFKIKPDAVVAFGGRSSIPAIFGARLLRIPTLIHEQNVIPGKVTRFLAHISDKVAVGFKVSQRYFKRKDTIFTGTPVRDGLKKIEKQEARRSLGLSESKFTILVLGGSQGAHFINQNFLLAIENLSDKEKQSLQIIHLSGEKDKLKVEQGYLAADITARVFSYLFEISPAYCASDLVVSRAGAGTLSEVIYFAKAAVLIPYAYAHAHQKENAKVMEDKAAAFVLNEDETCGEKVREIIVQAIKDPQTLQKIALATQKLNSDQATVVLAKLVEESVKR
ncbi:MAG: undecaprenyldiphospho-muramoylpentapeptide beta-N-acetylglucosaminyltransferase [PVC group bacterium]|nr:undecaprenyldiphospho-muramoylpentapeptide beta-N-acetylglucosaminyltransferase [PVC group bacterium]